MRRVYGTSWLPLTLPPAVLVHERHRLRALAAGPVAVAVPTYGDGVITITAVFASHARSAAEAVRWGRYTVSVLATNCYFTPGRAELRHGILVGVDLVPVGGDPGARITAVTAEADLSPGLRRCRAAFDAYLANDRPQQFDLLGRLERRGVRAFEPLSPVVEGIRDDFKDRARSGPRTGPGCARWSSRCGDG